jgi:hypothetical protein
VEQLETERVRKDGRHIAVALTLSPIPDGSGKLVSASEIGHDITDRRRGWAGGEVGRIVERGKVIAWAGGGNWKRR